MKLRKSQHVSTVSLMSTPIDRVREVIAASTMTQGEFAAAIDLDAPKLSKSLGGARRFTSSDYAKIAEIGNVTVDWLLTGDEPTLVVAARRAAGSSSQVAVAEAQRLLELRETANDLGHSREFTELDAEMPSGSARAQGERLAEIALAHVREIGRQSTEADLPTLIEVCFGVDVGICPLGDGFDGLSVVAENARLIVGSPIPQAARQRFTLAHELGHVLAGDDQGVHLDEDVYSPAARNDDTEMRANAFAACFLMPQDLLTDRVRPGFDERAFCALVLDCKVSPSALAIRLERLRLIDGMSADRFKQTSFAKAARLVGRDQELVALTAQSVTQRPPKLLAEDLFAAYSEGETTLRPYASLLGVSTAQLRSELELNSGGN